jgi:glycosyltransferase involved in cell wall biosynthesis
MARMSAPAERPLRILAIGDGGSIHTIRWLKRLDERGHELHLVSGRRPNAADDVGATTVYPVRELEALTRVPGVRRFRIAPAIRALAERIEPDVVHAQGMLPFAWWAAQADVHPLVVSPWGRDVLLDAKSEPGRSRCRQGFAVADFVVVNSQAILDASLEVGADRFVPDRVLHAQWHTRLDGFSPDRADRAALRRQFGWPEEALVVLSLRNFQKRTNVDVLVRAYDRVRREIPEARLLLAARGGETKAEIERLVADLGLGEVVRFHRVEASELPPLAASADLAVSIADTDSTPSSLLEAMASGLPLIGGWCPSIDEWIGPGEGAEMIETKDEDALVAALLKLLRDRELRRRYGERNAEITRRRVEESGPALEALYRELAGRPAPIAVG